MKSRVPRIQFPFPHLEVLEMDGGDGRILRTYLMPLNGTLKNGYSDKL